MKRILLISICFMLCLIMAKGQRVEIQDISTPTIKIGNTTYNKSKKGTFNATDVIHWTDNEQRLTIRVKVNNKSIIRRLNKDVFNQLHAQTVADYLKRRPMRGTSYTGTKSTLGRYTQNIEVNSDSIFFEKRFALVIGNSKYEHLDTLSNPKNDVDSITEKLLDLDFEVLCEYDLGYREFDNLLTYVSKLNDYDVVLIYYAGHGVRYNNTQYLIPIDAELKSEDDLRNSIPLDKVYLSFGALEDSKALLVFVDACRTEVPWQEEADKEDETRKNLPIAVIYSTTKDRKASDGEYGGNSPFATAFINEVGKPAENLSETLGRINKTLKERTGSIQSIRYHGSWVDFTFYKEQYDQAISILNSKQAKDLYDTGSPIEAITLLYNSLHYLEKNPTAKYSSDLEKELRYILNDSIAITKVLKGHIGKISKAYFTENNAELISIGSDSTLILWDIQTGKAVRTLSNLIKPLVSPNLRYVSSGPNENNEFIIYDIQTGFQNSSFNVGQNIKDYFFTNDSEHLAVCGKKSGLTIWDIKTGEVSSKTPFYYSGFWCDLSNDGSLLAYVNKEENENVLEMWNIHDNKLLFSNSIETEEIKKAIFSKNNEFVYTFDVSGNINTFKVATGQIVNTIKLGAPIRGAFFNADEKYAILDMPDGDNLLSMESGTIIKKFSDTYEPIFFEDFVLTIDRETKLFNAWDVSSSNKLSEFGPYVRNKVTSISKQGQALITLPNGHIVLYDIKTGKSLGELHYAYNRLGGLTSIDNGAIIADNGNLIAVTDLSGTISLWSIRKLQNPEQIIVTPSAERIRSLQISSKNLIIGSDENVEIVNLSNHKSRIIESTYDNFAISGENVYVGKDSLMIVYNIKKDKIISHIPFKHSINELEINEDKSLIAWADDYGNITLYNIATKSSDSLQSLERRYYINEILFSTDNKYLIALYDYNKIAIWDIATKTIVYKQECGTTLSNVSTSSTYSKFAFSSYDGFAYIVNPRTAEIEHTFKNSFGQGFIGSSLHPNKNLFMTVSYRPNNLIHIWNTKEGNLTQSLSSEKYEIRHAAFSKDGNNLYVVCILGSEKAPSDICLKIWDVNTWNLIYEQSFGKNLSIVGEYEDYYAYMDIGASQKIILEPIKSQIFNQSIITLLDKVKTILSN